MSLVAASPTQASTRKASSPSILSTMTRLINPVLMLENVECRLK
jgi:hypothetical protein